MKRMIRALIAAAVLVSSLTCSAFAVEDKPTTNIDGTVSYDGTLKYSASYDSATDKNQYVLLVAEGTPDKWTVTQDSILYIDQAAASGNTVSFTDFIPMTVADSVVLLGGNFGDGITSPIILGTIKSQYMLGDVNGDGHVRINDARLALQISLGKLTPTDTQRKSADVSQDGNVRVNDARLILQYTLGKITEF